MSTDDSFRSNSLISERIRRFSDSPFVLSQTTTKFGVLDEARINPHEPCGSETRTPFTLIRSSIRAPAKRRPELRHSSSSAETLSTTPYFSVSGQGGESVGVE